MDEGIQDFLNNSVRQKGMAILFWSLITGGIRSDIYEGTNLLNDLYPKFNFCCLRLSSKELQPHSLYKFSNETDLVRPVTILAASF